MLPHAAAWHRCRKTWHRAAPHSVVGCVDGVLGHRTVLLTLGVVLYLEKVDHVIKTLRAVVLQRPKVVHDGRHRHQEQRLGLAHVVG